MEMVGILRDLVIYFVACICILSFSLFYIPGDVLVILDLCPDESLFEAGIAREVFMLLLVGLLGKLLLLIM